jgi:hypothetical protein
MVLLILSVNSFFGYVLYRGDIVLLVPVISDGVWCVVAAVCSPAHIAVFILLRVNNG